MLTPNNFTKDQDKAKSYQILESKDVEKIRTKKDANYGYHNLLV